MLTFPESFAWFSLCLEHGTPRLEQCTTHGVNAATRHTTFTPREKLFQPICLDKPYLICKNNLVHETQKGWVSGGAGYLLNTMAGDLLLNGSRAHPKECNPHRIDDVDIS